jgi:K+-sensing histidine kinase KdpD
MPYRASDFIDDLRKKIAKDFPAENAGIRWDAQLNESTLEIDPLLLLQAFVEIFANAFQHEAGKGEVLATTMIDNGRLVLTLREPKQHFDLSTENWGREPLRHISRGHYGLGLNRARGIVEAHNGQFGARYDSTTSTLVTTIALPLAKE